MIGATLEGYCKKLQLSHITNNLLPIFFRKKVADKVRVDGKTRQIPCTKITKEL